MPRKIRPTQPTTGNQDLDRFLDETLESRPGILNDRANKRYDGVLGTLPDWMPRNFHEAFQQARNKVLDASYDAEQVRRFIMELIDINKQALAHPNNCYVRASVPFNFYKEINLMARLWTAAQMNKTEGLAYLTDQAHAERVEKGEKYGKHQSHIAKNPRGKCGSDGETLGQIIGLLACDLEYEEETAKDLWGHFYSALDEHGLDPVEESHPNDVKKCSYVYGDEDNRKSITFGQFANVVSEHRKKRRKSG
jgi:hypothetical protein